MTDFVNTYASWILAISGTAAMFVIGKKLVWGWLWFLFNEFMWITYALITKQYGFIFAAVTYGTVAIRSYIRWKKEGVYNQ